MKRYLFCVVLLVAGATMAFAQPELGLEYLGTIAHNWHSSWDIAISGNMAVVGTEVSGLSIMDISDPALPKEKGWLDIGGEAWGVAIRDNLAYTGGFVIIDISNPRRPFEVGRCPEAMANALDIFLSGNSAYVARPGGMDIIDISDPGRPSHTGSIELDVNWTYGVYVAENFAYLAAGDGGIYVLDVSNAGAIREVGQVNAGGQVRDIVIRDSLAFVAASGGGFKIYDTTDPTNLQLTGEWNPDSAGVGDVSLSGNLAYILAAGRCQIMDISNPADPFVVGSVGLTGYLTKLVAQGDVAFVTTDWYGLRVVDATEPENPTEIGFYNRCWGEELRYKSVTISDSIAYLCADDKGFWAFSLSNPLAPVEIGILRTPGFCRRAVFDNNLAYLADYNGGLNVVDVEEPSNLQIVGECDSIGNVVDVAYRDGLAFLACDTAGLGIVDVGDPENPYLLGRYQARHISQKVALYDNYALLGVLERYSGRDPWGEPIEIDSGRVHVIDVSDPRSPTQVSILRLPYFSDLAVYNSLLYVADYYKLHIYSLDDVSHLREISSYDTCGRVIPFGDYAVIHGDGIVILDTSDPTNLRKITSNNDVHGLEMLDASGGFIFAGDWLNLYCFQLTDGRIVADGSYPVPTELQLSSFPNPFNSSTRFSYTLPRPGSVRLALFDLAGREVAVLRDSPQTAGSHALTWNAGAIPAGEYFVRLQAGEVSEVKKVVVER